MKNSKCIVCDTNVLISAFLLSNSTPDRVISWIRKNGIFFFSEATFDEFKEVLHRPKLQKYLVSQDLQEILTLFRNESQFININQEVQLCRDPKDDKFLTVALEGKADYLISGDQDLLVLKKIGHTPIITPQLFLSKIEATD